MCVCSFQSKSLLIFSFPKQKISTRYQTRIPRKSRSGKERSFSSIQTHPSLRFVSFSFLLAAATTQRWDKALTLMMVMIHKKLELFHRGEFTVHEK